MSIALGGHAIKLAAPIDFYETTFHYADRKEAVMSEAARPQSQAESKSPRDRSPSYPCIPLGTAIERLVAFDAYFKRHTAPVDKAGLAWEMKERSSQAAQILAALRSFGLIDYQRNGEITEAAISEDGRTYLRAQQESIKQEVLKCAALRPKEIEKFWRVWDADRPPDPICLDELILKNSFSDRGAHAFLKVYDATIAYARLCDSDKVSTDLIAKSGMSDGDWNHSADNGELWPPSPPQGKTRLMEGERVIFAEEADPQHYVKLVASGEINSYLLDALSDFVRRQRKRLGVKLEEEDARTATFLAG
jgi:hypothetical protein